MKKIILLLIGVCSIQTSLFSQITPNGNSGSTVTAYTNGAPNDQIYIWCAEGLATTSASLTATAPSGTGPWTFEWFYHNQATSSWSPYTSQSGASSTISNLPSDGYRVEIYDAGSNLVGCYIAWVWNMNGDVSVNQSIVNCDATNLSGAISANSSFTYYNPPPPESIITSSTNITVCFSATHTWVSDLAFYLVGPASCGSPTILLSPNPGANGQGTVCNSGDNVNNLCFTTTSTSILNVCNPAPATLSGTYGGYGAGAGTLINWNPLVGCNAAQGGWRVQIYDCISSDVGSLTNATITFSNLASVCGSPTSISYTSGAINSAINDNSCSAGTASIFQVPVSTSFSTPITINASTSYLWTSNPSVTIPNSSTSLTPSVTSIPTGATWFYLTATVSYSGISCTYIDSVEFINTCCTPIIDAGSDVNFCTGSSAQIGTPAEPGMSYSWSPQTGLDDPFIAQPTVTLTNGGGSPINNNYTLTVTNTVDGGCTDTDDVIVTVNPLPTVSAGSYGPFCSTEPSVALSGTPAGGTFSGTGVTGNNFDPSAGTQTITYSYTDANGCSNSANTTITINNSVVVDAGTYGPVCVDAAQIALAGNPSGGTFSGTGVTGNSFDPASGTQTITYTYTNAEGCTGTENTTITVNNLPVVDAGSYGPLCEDNPSITLAGSPVGGTFSGTGVTGNSFDPSAGTQEITYNYIDGNACSASSATTITVNAVPLVSAGSYSTVCENAANIELIGSPVGGIFTGTGVTGTSFNPSVGSQSVSYDYTDANGCSNSANTLITVTPQVTIEVTSDNMMCDTTLIWAEWSSFIPNPVTGTVNGTNGVTVTHSNGDLTATAQMYNGGLFPTEYNVPTNSTAIRNDLAGLVTFCFDTPVTNPQIALSSIGNPGNPIEINTSDPYNVVWVGIDMTYLNNQAMVGEEGFSIISFPGTHTCISLDFLQSETYMNLAIGIEDIQCQTEPLCEGESVDLTASGASAYTWSPSEGLSSTSGSTVTATPEITTTYTVVDANDVGCSTVGSITVVVNPIPVADAGSYAAVCQDAADINLVGSPAGGIFSGNGVTGNTFDPSVGGSQTITYTYTDMNGCSDSDQTVIQVNALPSVSAGSDQTICEGNQITLSASGTTNYQWSNGVANGTSFTPPLGNSYYVVTGTNAEGCQQTDTLWIDVLSQPIASAWSSTTTGYPTLIVDIENNSQFANTYYWNFGNGASNTTYNLNSQTGIYTLPGTYYMTLVADNGYCTDLDSIQIIVIPFPDPILHVPNVFTPNGDGNNDVFFIDTEFVEELDLLILNRWGNVLYQSATIDHGWDGLLNGNEATEGVYFFRYKAVGINGTIVEGHGHLTLVR